MNTEEKIVNHTYDIIEVVLAGGGGITVMLTDIELTLKILIGIVTLAFVSYKFIRAIKEGKK